MVKHGESRVFTHIHVHDRFNFELTVYAEDKAHYVFKSSITGKAIERASIRELEELLAAEYPDLDLDGELEAAEAVRPIRTRCFGCCCCRLENVQGSAVYHPEGDVLYHSLQVFELARDRRPYDEEFLLAALLHDVGKGLDRSRHVEAALDVLEGLITERTRFLIEHHMHAHDYRAGTLGGTAAAQAGGVAGLRGLDAAARVRRRRPRAGSGRRHGGRGAELPARAGTRKRRVKEKRFHRGERRERREKKGNGSGTCRSFGTCFCLFSALSAFSAVKFF